MHTTTLPPSLKPADPSSHLCKYNTGVVRLLPSHPGRSSCGKRSEDAHHHPSTLSQTCIGWRVRWFSLHPAAPPVGHFEDQKRRRTRLLQSDYPDTCQSWSLGWFARSLSGNQPQLHPLRLLLGSLLPQLRIGQTTFESISPWVSCQYNGSQSRRNGGGNSYNGTHQPTSGSEDKNGSLFTGLLHGFPSSGPGHRPT